MSRPRIDLNADLGEGVGDDEAMLGIVSSASIATGAHAGGGGVLVRAVASAADHGVAIGAHPSYRDRAGFGRASHLGVIRSDAAARSDLVADLVGQILVVAREADRHGAALAHVKVHGSLYNEAVHDRVAAQVVTDAVLGAQRALGHGVAVMTQPGGELAHAAAGRGLDVIAEGFADRGYLSTGQLVPRNEPGALHTDPETMVAQALDLASGHVVPVDGPRIAVVVDSLCVHGDTPGAVAAARSIRAALEARGLQVAAPVGRPVPGGRTPMSAGDCAIRAFGDRALLIEPADGQPAGTAWVLDLVGRARRRWPDASVVPGLASVLVVFDRPSGRPGPGVGVARAPEDWAGGARDLAEDPGPGSDGVDGHAGVGLTGARLHVVGTVYDGPDLPDVAQTLGLPAAEIARRHSAADWTVAAIGFSPGFGYLTCTDPVFTAVGRRATPRTRVPRGSVALAAGMCAVYPSATPGGWQLIGSTSVQMFDVRADPPALLRVGDRVQFVEVPS